MTARTVASRGSWCLPLIVLGRSLARTPLHRSSPTTPPIMRRSLSAAFLFALASPVVTTGAQTTAPTDSALVARSKQDLDTMARDWNAPGYSRRAQARVRARQDSILRNPVRVDTVVRIRVDTVYVTKPDTAATPDTTVIVVKPPVDTTVVVLPPPAPTPVVSYPIPLSIGGSGVALAALPRDTVDATYPATTSLVRVPSGADLQAVLNAARPGDLIALARGGVYTGDFMLPKHAGASASTCSQWIVLRTDVADSLLGAPGTRMTPTKALALQLAKIQSPDNQQAIGSAVGVANVGCWRLVGLDVQQQPGNPAAYNANGLVRMGDVDATDSTKQAHHLILDRSYVHGGAIVTGQTNNPNGIRRCVVFASRYNAVVDSWLERCRGGDGDTQAILAIWGTGPYLVRNNHLSGGTEVLMSGGGTSGIVGAVPSDWTIHGNLFTRELADTVTLVKNLLELKNAERVDVAGNVFRLNWVGGQAGYAILAKSVNQSSGSCTWCRTRDFTFRYNRIAQSAEGINLAGIQEGPAQPSARFTLYHNWIDSLGYRAKAEGHPFQILGNAGTLTDVTIAYTTVTPAPWGLVFYDGGPTARQAWQSNVLYCGGYGAKGSGTAQGASTLTTYAPGVVWTNNALYGCGDGYPALGTTYAGSFAGALTAGAGASFGALLDRVEVAR